MDLKDIVSISGMSGLFKVIAKRPDGLIVQSFDDDKSKFVSNRIHVFTPLEGITVYTEDNDSVELEKIFPEMKKQQKDNPPVDVKADNGAIKAYFRKVLPNYDEERVYVSDIKKVIKWYNTLDEQGLIKVETKKQEKENKDKENKKTTKPKAKKGTKKSGAKKKATKKSKTSSKK